MHRPPFAAVGLNLLLACLVGAAPPIFPGRLTHENTPVIDGRLDDPAWQGAAEVLLARPILRSDVDIAPFRTAVKFLSREGELLVGAECRFPPGDNRIPGATQRFTQSAFENDSLELFLAPDGGRTPGPCFHLAIDLCGDTMQRKGLDAWESGWRSAVSLATDRWTAEMAIPMKGIGADSRSGHYWHINACRNIYGANGRFVQALTFEPPGYARPSVPLIPGPVRADILLAHLESALAAMHTMQPYLTRADRTLLLQLAARRNELTANQSGTVPSTQAAAVLVQVEKNDEELIHDIILNFMFANDEPGRQGP